MKSLVLTAALLATAAPAFAQSGDAQSFEHAVGVTEITGTPQRIVALETDYIEHLLALGVAPVGVADIATYKTWVNQRPEMLEGAADVGTRQEPSLEAIAALEPDLILAPAFRHAKIYDQLSAIAPTVMFDAYPEDPSSNQYDGMIDTFTTIADIVDRQAEAEQVLAELDATYQAAREELGDLAGSEFVLVQFIGRPEFRVMGQNSLASQILERIGLENAWEGSFDRYGFNSVGVEALAPVQDARFIYVAQPDDAAFQELTNNPAWQSLGFVKEGETYPLGGDTWLFAGPLSAITLVDRTVDALTNGQ